MTSKCFLSRYWGGDLTSVTINSSKNITYKKELQTEQVARYSLITFYSKYYLMMYNILIYVCVIQPEKLHGQLTI